MQMTTVLACITGLFKIIPLCKIKLSLSNDKYINN